MSDGFLHKYFLNNSKKTLHKWVHYFDIYERHFERFRGKSPTMIEIGVFEGGSLAMWKDYFGEGSKIIGIDINPACKAHEADGIEVFIGSQDDPHIVDSVFQKYPKIDLVLDDGSHIMRHMTSTFDLVYNRISPTGVYAVEDTHTCYWPEYEGGLGNRASFMEFTKSKFDEINAVHTRGHLPVTDFTRSTDSISVYDIIIVFEKRPQGLRQAPMTSPMP
jgi:cephalosporin hydroxylase